MNTTKPTQQNNKNDKLEKFYFLFSVENMKKMLELAKKESIKKGNKTLKSHKTFKISFEQIEDVPTMFDITLEDEYVTCNRKFTY